MFYKTATFLFIFISLKKKARISFNPEEDGLKQSSKIWLFFKYILSLLSFFFNFLQDDAKDFNISYTNIHIYIYIYTYKNIISTQYFLILATSCHRPISPYIYYISSKFCKMLRWKWFQKLSEIRNN